MIRFIATLIYYIDRLLPRTNVGGRSSERAYAAWEYESGNELLARYSSHIGSLAGKSVLDIGCGLGGKTVAYMEAGARAVGVDIEQRYIVHCLDFARSRGCDGVAFIVGDAQSLPFPDESFDVVMANDSMEHFPRPGEALRELSRVLRRGGSLILFFTPWGSPLGSHLYDYIRTPWCHLIFPRRLLRSLLEVVLEKGGAIDPAQEAERLMGEFDRELNRITLKRYYDILRRVPSLEKRIERREPPKFSLLAPLARVPLVGELFTGTLFSVLGKR